MLSLIARAVGALLLLICLLCAFGGVRAVAAGRPPLRGELVDIGGGRKMRIVCVGPKSDRPLVVTESGIFGFAADWGAVQDALAAKGIRSCAYDRAGLGFSDPGPQPRDGNAIVSDLEALLKAHGDDGPLILVGHSMAGLHTRLFALRNPERVKGLVLADGMSPQVAITGQGRQMIKHFSTFAGQVEWMANLGVLRAIAPWQGDSIGLTGAAHDEKVWFFGSARFNRTGAQETRQAQHAAEQVLAAGRLDPDMPVAVVTEGPSQGGTSAWGRGRVQAAVQSHHGFFENIEGATHASMIGKDHAPVIVRAVENVMAVAMGQAPPHPETALPPQAGAAS